MFEPIRQLHHAIRERGGFVNAHAHFDRAYSLSPEDFHNGVGPSVHMHLFDKWKQVDIFKSEATVEKYYQHITEALKAQKEFGTSVAMSFIDCDPVCGKRAIEAAHVAQKYAASINMKFLIACQTLKGVCDKQARALFEEVAPHVDIIGGLPGADKGREAAHIDVLLSTAKQLKKRVHVHVDQLNCASETETELLAKKTIEHGMHGQVSAVHAISIAAHPVAYRKKVYGLCREARLSFVACPTAWIDCRRSENVGPRRNAITPLDELLVAGLTVAIGCDNVADVYKPYSDGNMLTELRVLLEATHVYDFEALVNVATTNGKHVLGLV